jgi:hypothetical protein
MDAMERAGNGWVAEWLRIRGLDDWAAFYEETERRIA